MNEAKTMEAANDGTVVLECRQLAKAFRQGSERLEVLREVDFPNPAWRKRLAIVGEVPDRVRARCCIWAVWISRPLGSVWVAGQE
ncbi:MAG: hypothetical protein R3F44_03120 [Candidatus Competibacteraceae bacterium]